MEFEDHSDGRREVLTEQAAGKLAFLRGLFDDAAAHYDRIDQLMALGTGSWYRHRVLIRAGLRPGMTVLDTAVGTGLVARQAVTVVGDCGRVIGLDPSPGMLAHARRAVPIPLITGTAERLPVRDGAVDFISLGYALRHVSDLVLTFRGFLRVLKPGGILCILEISRPQGRAARLLLRGYLAGVVPRLVRLVTRSPRAQQLARYYWDTIETFVSPDDVVAALVVAGFTDVRHEAELGFVSTYTGRKPSRRQQAGADTAK